MAHPCLVVLTSRGTQRLLSEGGTQSWRLDPLRVQRLEYCVCVQNLDTGHFGGADHEQHTAFLIGRISGVVPSHEAQGRFLVQFSEYASVNCPKAWLGGRNPVRYGLLEDFGVLDPDTLDWHYMPDEQTADAALSRIKAGVSERLGLRDARSNPQSASNSLAEYKTELAERLGVPESAIEISIKF